MFLIKLKKYSYKTSNNHEKYIYNIIVCNKPFSRVIENIGSFRSSIDGWDNKYVHIDFDRLSYWIYKGAKFQPSLFFLIKPLIPFRFISK